MTVNAEFYNWQTHNPADDARYNKCSPNLNQLGDELGKRWGMTTLGCYGERAVRAGVAPSSHSHGAAIDRRYLESIGRARALSEVLPWLIDNSFELHISSIHDYIGCRIWHAGRGWKAQTPSKTNGMGQSWAGYFHIETTRSGWADNTPIPNRGDVIVPDPTPGPIPGGYVHTNLKLGSTGAEVYALQVVLRKVAGNTTVVADGQFGTVTADGVKMFQAWYGLTADGEVGPKTWAKIDQVVNT